MATCARVRVKSRRRTQRPTLTVSASLLAETYRFGKPRRTLYAPTGNSAWYQPVESARTVTLASILSSAA